ncbi:hypothetical protein AX15_004803 [Amanita polypyramis BW_CC]|nr:hypothetical protein AX15_004803 [Amanita polypyramis BW_CC]
MTNTDSNTPPQQQQTNGKPNDATLLTPETIEFAHRMFDAARAGNAELLLPAVDAGVPVNLTNSQGNTLLMLAAYAGHTELVRSLLARGGDPNRVNDRGQSVVGAAAYKGIEDMVKLLMENGADARMGRPTAIQLAAMFKRGDEMMKLLGAKEGDLDGVPSILLDEKGACQPASL